MSFQDKLKANQMKHAETALLQTIFQDPGQTIGDIWDALEADTESEAMWEMFKNLPIGKLVTAAASYVTAGLKDEEPPASAPAGKKGKGKTKPPPKQEEEEEEDEFEDDDDAEFEDEDDDDEDEFEDDDEEEEDEDEDDEEEEDDDEEEEDEDEDDEEDTKKAKSKKKGKAASTKKKKESASLDLSAPEAQKAYRHAIIKCLKANKARDEDAAMRSTPIRDEIGGDAKQFRDQVNELISAERVAFSGKARGTKYWLA